MIKNRKDKQNKESSSIEIKVNEVNNSEINSETKSENITNDNNGKQSNSDSNENIVKDDNSEKIKELEEQISKWKDQYLRKAAEFDNYKKRSEAEKSEFYTYASERIISELLPVLDDFERTMESFEKSHDKDALKKGIDLVYEKFKNVLHKLGLKEIESDGKKFDVHLHEAIMQQPDDDAEADTILNTIEKGYFLKDKILRHAKVVVSSKRGENGS
jgi:molecular chaperone GrpE